jgi:titin
VSAPQPALTPSFGAATSQSTGFTAQVNNYSSAYTWNVSSSAGSASINTSGLITVSGLSAGQAATVTVRTDRSGYSSGSATVNGQATAATVVTIQPALTPSFAAATSQATGFTAQVNNYNTAYTWTVTSSAGSASINTSGLITVSGLSAGQAATVTVRTARTGYNSGASTVSGQATPAPNQTALTPTFGAATKTNGGFYASITNFSSSYQWSASTTAGSVSINSSGQVTVTGLTQGQAATVTVRNTRSGYDPGTGNFSSSAIVTSLTPTFGALSSAINGFWIVITNYDPTFTWSITSSQGSASVFSNGNLGVSNIGRNTSVRVTVTATKNGISASASTTGSSN